MRDKPHAWQYRSRDAAEAAGGAAPAPREPAGPERADGAWTEGERAEDERAGGERAEDERAGREPAEGAAAEREPTEGAAAAGPERGIAEQGTAEAGTAEAGIARAGTHEAGATGESTTYATGGAATDPAGTARSTYPAGTAGERGTAEDSVATGEPGTAGSVAGVARVPGAQPRGTAAGMNAGMSGDARPDRTGVAGEQPANGRRAAEPSSDGTRTGAAGGEMMPGDVPEPPAAALFESSAVDGFRDRWQRLQMRFVDDPRGAADEARVLTDDVVSALHGALNGRLGALGGWQSGTACDTEELRVAVRGYRDLLDRLFAL